MKFKAPTYEEYSKATTFARIRYRFGVYIQFISAVLLLFLLFYTITNIEEMKANPIDYAEEKLGVMCFYPSLGEQPNHDGSYRNTINIEQG